MHKESLFQLDKFLELIDHDIELFESLMQVFSSDWPGVIDSIKQALENGDPAGVQKFGHRLKGNLKNFYADELAAQAYEVEEAGRAGELSKVGPFIESLEGRVKQLEAELNQALLQLKAGKS